MAYGLKLEGLMVSAGKVLPLVAVKKFPGVEALNALRPQLLEMAKRIGDLHARCINDARTPDDAGDEYRVVSYLGQDVEQMLQALTLYESAADDGARGVIEQDLIRKWVELRNECGVAWSRGGQDATAPKSNDGMFDAIAVRNLAVLELIPTGPLLAVEELGTLDQLRDEVEQLDETLLEFVSDCVQAGKPPQRNEGNQFRAALRLWNDVTLAALAIDRFTAQQDDAPKWQLLRDVAELRAQGHIYFSRFEPSRSATDGRVKKN